MGGAALGKLGPGLSRRRRRSLSASLWCGGDGGAYRSSASSVCLTLVCKTPILVVSPSRGNTVGGICIMGDKSPKATQKKATQKQSKVDAAQQKKKDAEAAKQVTKK